MERAWCRRGTKLVSMDVVAAIGSIFADLMPFLACWRAARLLHELLLEHVLKAPLHFFEVTPVGRILSRFSKDMDILDTSLPSQISDLMWCIFEVISPQLTIHSIFMAIRFCWWVFFCLFFCSLCLCNIHYVRLIYEVLVQCSEQKQCSDTWQNFMMQVLNTWFHFQFIDHFV